MIAIPNMDKFKECWECPCVGESDCQALELLNRDSRSYEVPFHGVRPDCPLIDIVTCGECKHRPIKDDPEGADYGFNIVAPTDRDDLCPCLVEDGWYSWMPEDNFYCGRGERRSE